MHRMYRHRVKNEFFILLTTFLSFVVNVSFISYRVSSRQSDTMDVETGAILALQILALCSIVAALLAYLMRQSRNAADEYESRNKRHVLVTSCDTCVGLQIALALYESGYKVITVARGMCAPYHKLTAA